jgi:hypothetical protein
VTDPHRLVPRTNRADPGDLGNLGHVFVPRISKIAEVLPWWIAEVPS